MTDPIGHIARIWRFPVKSMAGEQIEATAVFPGGLPGDRAWALVDTEKGQIVSAKMVKRFPGLMGFRAHLSSEPEAGAPLPPARITFPDGRQVLSDAANAEAALSHHFGIPVELYGLSASQSTGHVDAFPVSVMTTATLDALRAARPDGQFEDSRFRMNLIVDSFEDGFVENAWIGRTLRIGDALRLSVVMPDPRCVMVTLATDDLPADPRIMRIIAGVNSLPVEGEKLPCVGVYAAVLTPGPVQAGDLVSLEAE